LTWLAPCRRQALVIVGLPTDALHEGGRSQTDGQPHSKDWFPPRPRRGLSNVTKTLEHRIDIFSEGREREDEDDDRNHVYLRRPNQPCPVPAPGVRFRRTATPNELEVKQFRRHSCYARPFNVLGAVWRDRVVGGAAIVGCPTSARDWDPFSQRRPTPAVSARKSDLQYPSARPGTPVAPNLFASIALSRFRHSDDEKTATGSSHVH